MYFLVMVLQTDNGFFELLIMADTCQGGHARLAESTD